MAVNIIKTTGSGNTIPTHHRSDKSSQDNVLADVDTGDLIIPRFIYSKLSNLVDARTIQKAEVMLESNEYALFMMQMEQYHITGENVNNIALIDEYLGDLGVLKDYPFLKDAYTVEGWVTTLEQEEFRNVVDTSNGTMDNIVTDVNGTMYNVIHRVPL